MTLTYGELFAGYGGLGLAIESVFGAELEWYAEFDEAPSRIMARHWPHAPNLGDVTSVDWSKVRPVDIISGGSPCQDVSAAGRRAGMTEGTRSNLWAEMREAIAVIKPTYVVWENVRGALSAKAASASDLESSDGQMGNLRALGRVLGDLTDLGYDTEWRVARASEVGAPHRRERVFVLAWRRDAAADSAHIGHQRRGVPPGRPGGSPAARGCQEDHSPKLLPTVTASDTNGPGAHGNGGADLRTTVALLPTPKAGDADFGLPHTSGRPPERSTHMATRLHYTDFGTYAAAIHRWGQVLGRPAPPPTELSPRGKHRLSEHFTEWMMGLPVGWICDTEGVNRNAAIRAAGNGVVPQQAEATLLEMVQHKREGTEW